MVRANTLGATAIAAAITAGVASLEPANIGAADLWSNRKAVSEEQLDTMRGGFEAPNGLQVSFGIERAVFINGELVAATRLIVSNLPNLLRGGSASAQALANAFTVVQNGPGNSVENQPAPAPVAAPPSLVAATTPSTAAAASATSVGPEHRSRCIVRRAPQPLHPLRRWGRRAPQPLHPLRRRAPQPLHPLRRRGRRAPQPLHPLRRRAPQPLHPLRRRAPQPLHPLRRRAPQPLHPLRRRAPQPLHPLRRRAPQPLHPLRRRAPQLPPGPHRPAFSRFKSTDRR